MKHIDFQDAARQDAAGRKGLLTAGSPTGAQNYTAELARFLALEYGFQVEGISPAKRGFYGETWNIQTKTAAYFLKIDYWLHHEESYRNSLPVIQYMTSQGISFIPKIIAAKDGRLYSRFRQGTAALFSHISGEWSKDCSTAQLYGRLSKIYRLKAGCLALKAEHFGTERIQTFLYRPEVPAPVRLALSERNPDILRYMARLKKFSALCMGGKENYHITHGDAGGNCILNENQLFLVDWDSVMLAPIERDAWIFICNSRELQTINFILAENGIDYVLEPNRLCYYCYDFFFYYLNEYLQSIIDAKSGGQRSEIAKDLTAYLADCWIYERLETADAVD